MENVNVVSISGNLTRDAEMIYANSGAAILKFSIAVNSRRKEGEEWKDVASFFDLVMFGKRAEALSRFLTKGVMVFVEGKLEQQRWQDKESGANKSRVQIIVKEINFTRTAPPESAPDKVSQGSYEDGFSDDLPF